MPNFPADAVWRLASEKWAEIRANLPDLAPAVALQQRLLELLLAAAIRLDGYSPPRVDRDAIARKWASGLPALRSEQWPIPEGLVDMLAPICTALAEAGAGDSAIHIRAAIASRSIDAESLLRVSLARNRKAIRTSALHMGFAPDLVWLIGELGSSPLAHHLQLAVGADLGTNLSVPWERGYCPYCGSWPAFIELHDGTWTLRCSYCAHGWPRPSGRCIYCGNGSVDFVGAAPDPAHSDRRVDLCGQCGGYTKVIETREPILFPLVAVEDLATLHLYRGAMHRGYQRPDLFDLDTIDPPGC